MSVTRYDVNGPSSVFEDVNGSLVDYKDYAELEARCVALAAENAGLKAAIPPLKIINDVTDSWDDVSLAEEIGFNYAVSTILKSLPETPDTDAFLAEVRAHARNEGINYAASRLAAAFNHGFVDKPLAEVFDVVRMILDTKEELANSTLPAADGLSGEYAEKFITEFAAQLRKGDAQ
ncbi:TPA: hypothetical protein O4G90_004354 [Citrobacter amalonaticus]|nr:hypothetical protein [Citrobacter amalonaticus]